MTTMDVIRNQDISRRRFLQGTGGLTFAVAFGTGGLCLTTPAMAKRTGQDISVWVRIMPDDRITIVTPAAEMGQGSMTGVPIVLAEELDADWSKVTLEMAPAEPEIYGYEGRRGKSMAIVGSRAVMQYFDAMRIAGAKARRVLLENAAEKWKVPLAELTTEPSVVIHAKSGRRMSYGEIAGFAKISKVLPKIEKSDLKKRTDFRLIGKSVPRSDIPAKTNGSAVYSMDVQLPEMVYATSLHSPVQNGEPARWNADAVKALPGVIDVVRVPGGIAVVADSFPRTMAAKAALEVEWAKGAAAAGFDSETALDAVYAKLVEDAAVKPKVVDSKGDADAFFSSAAKTYKSEYRSDLGYHAQMEPLNAVARFNEAGDKVEIWDGTQAPGWCRRLVAEALGFKTGQVTLHQCYLGGGYGRRSRNDYAAEAALVARAVKRPVKLIWTREEDIAYGMFRPQSYQCLEAALDKDGKVRGWKHCVVGDGDRLLTGGMKIPYYGIPNQHIDLRGTSHGIRLKHWRAVAHVFNVFAIEAFVDEMAAAEGVDPLTFRRERMAMTKKAREVFDAVAEMSNWGKKRPAGRALGLSITERSGSLGAGVVEISLDRQKGKIRVHKAWLAIDGGIIVMPDAARANVESGIVHGLSSVLTERVTMKNGAVEQSNFHDYRLLRMADAPEELHVKFLARDTKPTGIGEIANPFAGAAVANAFHALTGKRLRHMPFTPERVKAALKA